MFSGQSALAFTCKKIKGIAGGASGNPGLTRRAGLQGQPGRCWWWPAGALGLFVWRDKSCPLQWTPKGTSCPCGTQCPRGLKNRGRFTTLQGSLYQEWTWAPCRWQCRTETAGNPDCYNPLEGGKFWVPPEPLVFGQGETCALSRPRMSWPQGSRHEVGAVSDSTAQGPTPGSWRLLKAPNNHPGGIPPLRPQE